jgi:hypothetical protein
VIGKVLQVEEQPVQAYPLLKVPGGPKVAFRVARVRIESTLLGAGKQEQVRDAVGPGRAMPKQAEGQQGCFFLHKHPDESFNVLSAGWDFIDKTTAKEYDSDLALARRSSGLLADTDSGLRSKDAEDRLLTAAMLIYRYRTARYAYRGEPRTEPVDPQQSKRLLEVIAEGPLTGAAAFRPLGRMTLFLRLGITEEDGWTRPKNFKDVPAAAEKWLSGHAATYRILRYVPEE